MWPSLLLSPWSYLVCIATQAANCFSWHLDLQWGWEWQLLELMSVPLLEAPGWAGSSPGTPSHQSITFSTLLLWQPLGEEAYTSDENWTLVSLLQWFSECSHLQHLEPRVWLAVMPIQTVMSCAHLGRAMGHFDTCSLNVPECLCFWITLVSICETTSWFSKEINRLLTKARAVCVCSSEQPPGTWHLVFIGKGERGKNHCHLRNVSQKWQ